MSIVDGTGLVTWEGGLFLPNSDLLRRTQWAFGQIRAAGGTIILNEAGRPFGVPHDADVRNAWQTASGLSTVWFQWGRYLRGESPSAANPNNGTLASEHTQGKAIDCDAPTVFDATLRAKFFHQVGMVQTIASESWHWAIRSDPTVTLSAVAVSPITTGKTPPPPSNPPEDDMNVYQAATASTDGLVQKGWIYVQDADGPLRAVDSLEAGVYLFKQKAVPNYIIAQWNGDDIRSLIARVGLRSYDPIIPGLKDAAGSTIQGPGKLNGTIRY